MANPFDQIPSQGESNHSYSPETSYLRPNIAVPVSFKAASVVATEADTELESRLPSTVTTASVPTPASAGAGS